MAKKGLTHWAHTGMCCIAMCLNLALVTFLGIYAFNNPDPVAVYAEVDNEVGMYSYEKLDQFLESGKEVDAFVDVHFRFRIWFTWGFVLMIFGTCYCCINLPTPSTDYTDTFAYNTRKVMVLITTNFCCYSCFLVWYAFGVCWRLCQSGSFASGDITPADLTSEDTLY